MKTLRYLLEAGFLHGIFFIFACMPTSWASNTGGFLGRVIGPRLATSRKAAHNMQSTYLDLDTKKTIADMWENLGRTIAEYPHLKRIIEEHTEFIGKEHIEPYTKEGKPLVFVSGHFANWEMSHCGTSFLTGNTMHCVYREPNNPWVRKLLHSCRMRAGDIQLIPKSRSSVKQMMQVMQNSQQIGILIDQKYNEGIAVPFLGKPAMTGTAFVKLAQKFDTPIFPVRIERVERCNFRVSIGEPIIATDNIEDTVAKTHTVLEEWIKERPGQWLWLHRRWNSEALQETATQKLDTNEKQEAA